MEKPNIITKAPNLIELDLNGADSTQGSIKLNGETLSGVLAVSFHVAAGGIARTTITLLTDIKGRLTVADQSIKFDPLTVNEVLGPGWDADEEVDIVHQSNGQHSPDGEELGQNERF